MNEVYIILLAVKFIVLIAAIYYSLAFVARLSYFLTCVMNKMGGKLESAQSLVPSILWATFWLIDNAEKIIK